MRTASILAAGALAASAAAENYLGFNSGARFPDESAKFKKDFADEFKAAKNLENAPGDFTAVRLYTNIQAYAEDDPIEAFEAAIETDTKILLGVWASGVSNIDKELTALKKAVDKYGKDLTDLVIGISIGSEDLYRTSVTGIENDSDVGNTPDAIVSFISDFKKQFKGSALGSIPVGHVDTWDVWTNSSNSAVMDAIDWIGVNSFPYYETGKGNNIKNAPHLFDRSYEATLGVANGKPVWVTETGWPSSGPKWDEAVASVENAKYFWDEVGCRQLFGKTSTFWYILRDSNPANKMQFTITKDLTKPLFDLTCPSTFETDSKPSSSSESASPTSTGGSSSESSSSASPTGGSDSSQEDDPSASQAPSTDNNETDGGDGESAAMSVQAFTVATYAALAVTAGFFALF